MKDLGDIMRQAQEMQKKLEEAQSAVEDVTATGQAGGGLVRMTLKGKGEMVDLSIDKSLSGDDTEIIEDLVKAAHTDAKSKLEAAIAEEMKKATSGFGGMMPGFKMPF